VYLLRVVVLLPMEKIPTVLLPEEEPPHVAAVACVPELTTQLA
jgi:hypothetical protein